jgi:hypothetical protein
MDGALVTAAIKALRGAGYTVEFADIPGLYYVNGRELTRGQVVDLVRQLGL